MLTDFKGRGRTLLPVREINLESPDKLFVWARNWAVVHDSNYSKLWTSYQAHHAIHIWEGCCLKRLELQHIYVVLKLCVVSVNSLYWCADFLLFDLDGWKCRERLLWNFSGFVSFFVQLNPLCRSATLYWVVLFLLVCMHRINRMAHKNVYAVHKYLPNRCFICLDPEVYFNFSENLAFSFFRKFTYDFLCILPRMGLGYPHSPFFLPCSFTSSSFGLFPFFSYPLYHFSFFVHLFPYYQNSPTPFLGRRS